MGIFIALMFSFVVANSGPEDVGVVSTAGPARILLPTPAARSVSVGVPHVEQITPSMGEMSEESRRVRSTTNNNRKSEVVGDVAEEQRKSEAADVRNNFSDIFKVSDVECEILEEAALASFRECNVAARLSRPESVEFFRKIGAPPFILKVLEDGYFPKFKTKVPPLERKNNASFRIHNDWAVKEVKNMIESDRVEIVSERPYCVLPLHVVIQPKKNRLVLDCGILNDYIDAPKFKLDDYKSALSFFKDQGWLLVFDFKDGYYHVKLHEDFRPYVGFQLILDGKLTYCRFKVGFLGLVDMPWLFTKVFRVLVKHWRSKNIPCCLYLDDGWVFGSEREEVAAFSRHIRSDLWQAGVVWSIKKCIWVPSRRVEWLGMVWDAEEMTLKITERRIEKLLACGGKILEKDTVLVRTLASWAGQVNSLGPVLGNVTRLFSRFTQMVIAKADSYDDSVSLSAEVVKELVFWNQNVRRLNSRNCAREEPPICLELRGDASASGCGSFITGSKIEAARLFTQWERETHSTWRELENIRFSLEAMKKSLEGRAVTFLVDNKSAAAIVQSGSMKEDCHKLALDINQLCASYGISLCVQWIPREQNKEADALSRAPELLDTDDWGLTEEFFRILQNRWGPFSIDCFANYYNNKVERFYSLFLTPNAAGVDAFNFDWAGETCLLVPPVAVVGRALNHLHACKSKGVLVVPYWPSAAFWPMLLGFFRGFIQDVLVVKANKVLVQGRNKNSLLGSEGFNAQMLAMLIDCNSIPGI